MGSSFSEHEFFPSTSDFLHQIQKEDKGRKAIVIFVLTFLLWRIAMFQGTVYIDLAKFEPCYS